MAQDPSSNPLNVTTVTTTDGVGPTPAQPPAAPMVAPVPVVPLPQAAYPTAAPVPAASPNELYQGTGPEPGGIMPGEEPKGDNDTQAERMGQGVEGENVVWESRYALKNFVGRIALAVALTIAWLFFAAYSWGWGVERSFPVPVAVVLGLVLLVGWLALIRRIVINRYGHFYRLTNRRLFVSTGLMNRRRDQMELLRIQDVYTKQSLIERLMSLGTVVIVSQEPNFPILYLAGVNDPKSVHDLVWHYARAERDNRSVKVDQI